MSTTHKPTGNNATATPTDNALDFALFRVQAESALLVALSELSRAAPDFDKAYDFADKALGAIGTLRILNTFANTTQGGQA